MHQPLMDTPITICILMYVVHDLVAINVMCARTGARVCLFVCVNVKIQLSFGLCAAQFDEDSPLSVKQIKYFIQLS